MNQEYREFLIKVRKDNKLTQDDMASKLGLSKRMYCYYEKGEKEIPLKIKLAVEGQFLSPQSEKNGISDFDRRRIEALASNLKEDAEFLDFQNEKIPKMMAQSARELEYLLSKVE
tara:strand:- start:1219 stop:1563 length:345 start_codon:yes stop_codon:yes gene_type:complete